MVYRPKGRRFSGKRILKRTKAARIDDARDIESAAIHTELERGNCGILKPRPLPSLAEFLKGEFLPFVEARFRKAKANMAIHYGLEAKMLLAFPLASMKLDAITDREAGQLVAAHPNWKAAYLNKRLRTLRRALSLASEWGKLTRKPKITLAKIAGHAAIAITMLYCHPQAEAVAQAFRKFAEGVPTK